MAFTYSGTTVYAFNAETGALEWTSTSPDPTGTIASNNGIAQLDSTYFLTQGGTGITVRDISTGALVWNYSIPAGAHGNPGSGTYFGGRYSTSMQMYFDMVSIPALNEAGVEAFNLANPAVAPTQPAWTYLGGQSVECLCCGGGLLFLGSTEGEVIALNATGSVVWQASTEGGLAQQAATYYNGYLYTSAVSWYIDCFNATTGQLVWQTSKGTRAFTAYDGAAGGGLLFEATDETVPQGSMGAWNLLTGQRVWYNAGYYDIHYDTLAVADGNGLVYGVKDDSSGHVSTEALPGPSFSCWDMYTGQELWNLPGISFTDPTIAYGNLYACAGGNLYCIGGNPTNWSEGLQGNNVEPRVAIGTEGPTDISTPTWSFQTGADTYSSPAIVNGYVYFGSDDQNLYCLNAYTGQEIWNYTTGFYLRSSPCVDNGMVFTGDDDGYFYCLNALTGAQIWKTSGGGFFPNYLTVNEGKSTSSPIAVNIAGNNLIFCGSKDDNLYCINEQTGAVQWTYKTGGPIFGSPGYSNGIIYIASSDGYLYAVNANGGSLAWKSSFQLNDSVVPPIYCQFYEIADPTIANGEVYIGGGVQYGTALYSDSVYAAEGQSTPAGANGGGIRLFAFNASTGAMIWDESRAGNTEPAYYPCVLNGQLYAPEFFEITDVSATAPNSTGTVNPVPDFVYTERRTGNCTWASWLGYQIQGCVAYAQGPTGGVIYAGSDLGTIYAINATSGNVISLDTVGGNIPCSPSVWNGMLFCGCTDGRMYCWDGSPQVPFSLSASSSKGSAMWNNETNVIAGTLKSSPSESVWNYASPGAYVSTPMTGYNPGVPGLNVTVVVIQPDGTHLLINTTTALDGTFTASFAPTQVGTYTWLAEFTGTRVPGEIYTPAYTTYSTLTVTQAPAPPATPTPTVAPTIAPTPTQTTAPTKAPTPTPTTVNNTTTYAIVAIIVIIIIIVIAVAAYLFTKRRKKQPQKPTT
jgi:outer membrane protein assembly factor BamB